MREIFGLPFSTFLALIVVLVSIILSLIYACFGEIREGEESNE
jgi:hypothetical protein